MFVEFSLKVLTGLCKMPCSLSHDEKPLQGCQNKKSSTSDRGYVASALISATEQGFPRALLGELTAPGQAPLWFLPISRETREYSEGICCSSAWQQQRQRSNDRPFLDEKLELSSKAPCSLKHIWNDLSIGAKEELSYPSVFAVLFCHTEHTSRGKDRIGELTQEKAVQNSWAISPQKINDKRLWRKPICNGM